MMMKMMMFVPMMRQFREGVFRYAATSLGRVTDMLETNQQQVDDPRWRLQVRSDCVLHICR
jgi:hypothetical protein